MAEQNEYQIWSDKLRDHNGDIRAPEMLAYTIKHMAEIVRDARDWEPVKEYKYMLTFTMDPKKIENTDMNRDKIELYICNLMRKAETSKCYYSKEHELTNCHWHVILHRKSALKSDYLSYYKKTFGHVDVSRSKDLGDTNSMKYLSKEGKIYQIV